MRPLQLTSLPKMEPIVDALLQFLDLVQNLSMQLRPVLFMIRSNPALREAFIAAKSLYAQLPENVSLSLTVAVVFLSSLLLLRVGRSIISLLVFCFQVVVLLVVGFVLWRLRDSLTDFFEYILRE